jgi:DNA-binding HxlR family transcriptional regulator
MVTTVKNQKCLCPLNAALYIVGGKWKLKILYHLLDKPKRFGELRKLLPNITQQMLTIQLRELEQDGAIHREIYKEIPPKVEYSMTDFGRSLTPVLNVLLEWGKENASTIEHLREIDLQ